MNSGRVNMFPKVLLGVLLLVALFLAVIIPLSIFSAFMFLLLLISGVSLTWLYLDSVKSNRWFIVVVYAPIVVFPLIYKIIGVSLFPIWQVYILLMSVAGVGCFYKFLKQHKWFRLYIYITFIFLTVAIVSSLLGRSTFIAAAYQFVSDVKPTFLIVLGFVISWDKNTKIIFWWIIDRLWILLLGLIVFEWTIPNIYFSIFPVGPNSAYYALAEPTGIFPSRALGSTEHPSFLASISSVLFSLSICRYWSDRNAYKNHFKIALLYLVVLVCSVQRQELFSCVIASGIAFLMFDKSKIKFNLMKALPIVFVCGAGFVLIYGENIQDEYMNWGGSSFRQIQQPRAQLFAGAVNLSEEFFPLGAGLGTYGGAGSKNFDLTTYDKLGFKSYWWYGKEDYLMDTYWPNSLGETGILGAIILFLSYIFLIIACYHLIDDERYKSERYMSIAIFSLMIYMLLLSFSSPSYQDPRLFIIPAMLIGYVVNSKKDEIQ